MRKEMRLATRSFGLTLGGQKSWEDVVHDWVDRTGLNLWLVYGVAALLLVLLLQGLHWASGALPVGQLSAPLIFTGMITPVSVAFAHHLDHLALACLRRFRVALAVDETEYAHLAKMLTRMPAAPVWWSHLIGLAIFAAILRLDPTFYGMFHGKPLADAALYLIGGINSGIVVVNLYHTWHQLSWVQTIHARAQTISVIDRTPAFAFSALAYQTSALGMALIYGFIYLFPALRHDPVGLGVAGSGVLMLLTFFLPMQGIHERLADDKDNRLTAVRQQIEATFSMLHRERKAEDAAAVEQLVKQVPALLQEEEYLSKLSTWPWLQGTLNKLMTVAILPLLLLVADRMLNLLLR